MIPRTLSAVAAILGLVFGLLSSPASMLSAEAAVKPGLTFQVQTKTVPTPCGNYSFDVRVPVLVGSTQENRNRVAAWADWVRAEIATFANDEFVCSEYLPIVPITTTSEGSIYQGRYVSVMAKWRGDVEGGLRTLNFDLKTGRAVPVTKFVSDKGKQFTWAKCMAFVKIADYLVDSFCPEGQFEQAVSGWRVSTKGIQVYGEGDDSYFYSPLIVWSSLVKASYAKSKKHTTKKVSTINSLTRDKEKSTVTLQGNLVTVRKPTTKAMQGHTYYGVKSAGKKVSGKWRVLVFDAEWGPMLPNSTGYVYFASKGSARAVKHSYIVYGD